MNSIWQIIYNIIFIPTMNLFIRLASLFNSKIKKGVAGRKKLFENLIIDFADLDRKKKLIWFHSSSLGEFEQAKPIIEKLKATFDLNIFVTFFSPSGYDNSVRYPFADVVSYLPLDSSFNMERFVKIVNPGLVILMRYDIWPNMIWKLGKRNIPLFLVDATMRSNSLRLSPLFRNFHKELFKYFSRILTVSDEDGKNFAKLVTDKQRIITVGDTRFDRVYQKSLEAQNINLIDNKIIEGKKVFVVGSSWPADEDVLLPVISKLLHYDKNIQVIIAPHEPSILRLEEIENYFIRTYSTIRFSHLKHYNHERIIIIDSIGILLSLYTYAHIAFVGGSFKQGIHNILEPAVYGIPVLFGPKIENSQEAQLLVKLGGSKIIRTKTDAYRSIRTLFSDNQKREMMGEKSMNFVKKNLGATKKIIEEIVKFI